ncbi:MAG: hypothetical protein ABR913_05235 [Sedimentisphaerales bacterium]
MSDRWPREEVETLPAAKLTPGGMSAESTYPYRPGGAGLNDYSKNY